MGTEGTAESSELVTALPSADTTQYQRCKVRPTINSSGWSRVIFRASFLSDPQTKSDGGSGQISRRSGEKSFILLLPSSESVACCQAPTVPREGGEGYFD